MLDWVTGASRSQHDANLEDVPETPAHIFAARAFKSLLFGTPAPNDMTVEKPKRLTRFNTISKISRRHSSDVARQSADRSVIQPPQLDPFVSPSKGILIAPGSISTKRKSVTFGSLGRGANARKAARDSKSMEHENDIPTIQPEPVKLQLNLSQEDLRKSLFQTHNEWQNNDGNGEKVKPDEPSRTIEEKDTCDDIVTTSQDKTTAKQATSKYKTSRFIEDQTIDLDQPRSTSGQHWKREYERDHNNSKAEMKKLIQYSQMTKSYAEKRDRDAITVIQKLKESEAKAKVLDTQIRKLAAQLMNAKTHGEEQDLILYEVASQTAEVMKHKGNAERYRAALRKYEELQADADGVEHGEKKDLVVSADIAGLKSDLLKVRLAADRAEARAARAEYENTLLNAMVNQMKDAKQNSNQQHDKLHDRLNKKASQVLEENRRLSEELHEANIQCSTMKEELRALKKTSRVSMHHNTPQIKDKLFELKYSRFTKEPSPPSSDEDLRKKNNALPSNRMAMPNMDFSIIEDLDNTYSHRRTDINQPMSNRKRMSSPSNAGQPLISTTRTTLRPNRRFDVEPVLAVDSESEYSDVVEVGNVSADEHALDDVMLRKSSPLMKSFVDNLGSRRVLPPERVAAAKKRLEEKAADRRSTPMYTKVRDKIIV